jgi:hypothetical protein
MPEMVSAYIYMCAEPEMPARPRSDDDVAMDDVYRIHVINMFGEWSKVGEPLELTECN